MYIQYMLYPRHTVKFSDDDWDLQSPPKRIVFKIHWILKDIYIYIYAIHAYILEYPSSQHGSGKVKVTEALNRNRDVLDFPLFLY